MNDKAPEVSVIMNCLNCERYLPAALDSVRAQTFQNLEIIFWDNHSSDDSAAIAKNYGPALRYFSSPETVPLGQARNLAISKARGEYIAFLDCDDLWRPQKLEKQIGLFRANPALGLACTDTVVANERKQLYRLFTHTAPMRGMVFPELMLRQWVSMSSAVLRKSALAAVAENEKWFDENLNLCEEADLFYRIAHDYECDFVDEPLTVWRIHGQNTTIQKFGRFADETLAILAKHRQLYPGYASDHPELVQALETRAAFQKSIAVWQQGEGKKARELLAPYRHLSRKYQLFWWLSYLPGGLFESMAKIYFALPAWLRN